MIKGIFYMATVIIFYKNPILQIILMQIPNLLLLILQLKNKIYKSRNKRIKRISLEITNFLISNIILLYALNEENNNRLLSFDF
jgi:hypothetical protein